MLGGGVFVTQNKTLPGSYINFVNATSATSTVGERGVVAISLPIGDAGSVVEVTPVAFATNCEELLGVKNTDASVAPLREILKHASKVYVYCYDEMTGTEGGDIVAFEAYEFNVLCAYTDDASLIADYTTAIKTWRDEYGKKCQLVVYNQTKPDYEGIINVVSTVTTDDTHESVDAYALVAWVAGVEAAANVNQSCTNMLYDGEYTIVTDKTLSELEDCIKNGQVAFHLVYGDVRLLEDVNSLTTTTVDKGEDFKYNQTIRVIDQIANDIAKLFNVKYIGKIPNTDSGRTLLWSDIVKHHRQLEEIGAIENFDSSLLTVVQGGNKKSVVVNDVITVVNSMAQLYMTVVIQ